MPIKINDVSFTYQPDTPFAAAALRRISTCAYTGETIGIAGHTGSGKSTLVQLIAGLLLPDSGEIELADLRLSANSKIRPVDLAWRVSFVFQDPSAQLFCETVESEIGFAAHNLGWDEAKTDLAVRSAMAQVGLSEAYLPRNPLLLSGGEKRRVAMASALVTGAPIIILDEPLAGLDSRGKAEVGRLLRRLQQAQDKIILCVSHDMDFIADYCDRVWLLSDGQLLADGPVAEVFSDDALLSAAAVQAPTMRQLQDKLAARGWSLSNRSVDMQHVAQDIVQTLRQGGDNR